MNEYRIFGHRFRSAFPFPELPIAEDSRAGEKKGAASRTVTFRRAGSEAADDGVLLGEESLPGAGELRLHREGHRLRLTHDAAGVFDVHPDDDLIEWHGSNAAVSGDLVRSLVLGRVLPVLLYGSGLFPLHASGAVVNGGAVAFMAPKGYGKSTMALLLGTRGARLLADDTLPLAIDEPVLAGPGDEHAKVWNDAAGELGLPLPDEEPIGRLEPSQTAAGIGKRKYLLTRGNTPALQWASRRVPLAAVYYLLPTPGAEDRALESEDGRNAFPYGEDDPPRRRIGAVEASLALMSCTKIAPLLHRGESGELLERASCVSERVPVYGLAVPRDLTGLGVVADAVLRWHGAPESHRAAGEA